jgi:hypothetical protein
MLAHRYESPAITHRSLIAILPQTEDLSVIHAMDHVRFLQWNSLAIPWITMASLIYSAQETNEETKYFHKSNRK